MAVSKLDEIDRKILAELQADERMTNVELAKKIFSPLREKNDFSGILQ